MINYNFIEKSIHDLILGNNLIKNTLYDLEKLFFLDKKDNFDKNNHVFICGLPRSGTTALLNFLHKSNLFGSLTYNDMPFILAPNLFKKFNFKKNLLKKERFHNDGIQINLDSPEALDETFLQMNLEDENLKEYKNYINLVLKKYKKIRYLSKNNNNFKRLKKIENLFPNAITFILFRNPIQQSNSLLCQNNNFLKLNKQIKFSSRYMKYIGHNEFGINHKPWFEPISNRLTSDINYWLEQWILFYEYILNISISLKNYRFICYENLTSKNLIFNLNKTLKINKNLCFKFKNSNKNLDLKVDENLKKRSQEIYDELKSKSI